MKPSDGVLGEPTEGRDGGGYSDEDEGPVAGGDSQEYPPELPLAVEDYGVTAFEASTPEPLTLRLRRETGERAARAREMLDREGRSAEELAMHVEPEGARVARQGQPHGERLDLLEAEAAVLLRSTRVVAAALDVLAEGLEQRPDDVPDTYRRRVNRAAHEAHELVLELREGLD